MSLLVLAPLRLEARALRAGASTAIVTRTGAGPRRAAQSATRLLAGRTDPVVVAGVAGALIPGLDPGTVVVADRVVDAADASAIADLPSASLLVAALRRRGLRAQSGAVATTKRVVRGAERAALARRTGALAVDMESAAIAAVNKAPFAVVRVIADTPELELFSPATIRSGREALRILSAVAPAVEEWGAAAGPRTILLAGPRAFCAGVERAVDTVRRAIERFGAPVYVRRQIVHNRHVITALEAQGAIFVRELDEVPDGATVVFSAHGVSPTVEQEARRRGLNVVDATCPLVAKVHREVVRFAERGYQVVLIGHSGHDETEGTLGYAPDISLIEGPDDAHKLDVRDPSRLAYVTQTTLSPGDVAGVVNTLSALYPGVIGPAAADVCYASQNRQDAVRAVAAECDLVLVIGSSNSSNAHRLVEVAESAGCPTELIDDEHGIELSWLVGRPTVGITAAASTPHEVVDRVLLALAGLGPLKIEERSLRTEKVAFPLPTEVR